MEQKKDDKSLTFYSVKSQWAIVQFLKRTNYGTIWRVTWFFLLFLIDPGSTCSCHLTLFFVVRLRCALEVMTHLILFGCKSQKSSRCIVPNLAPNGDAPYTHHSEFELVCLCVFIDASWNHNARRCEQTWFTFGVVCETSLGFSLTNA